MEQSESPWKVGWETKHEVIERTSWHCSCCGREFLIEHLHGGAIEHGNIVSNMAVFVSRWDDDQDGDALLMSVLGLDDNHCNIKGRTEKIGHETFSCAVTWLKLREREGLREYLLSRANDISKAFNAVRQETIAELRRQIKAEEALIEEEGKPFQRGRR